MVGDIHGYVTIEGKSDIQEWVGAAGEHRRYGLLPVKVVDESDESRE